MENVEEHLDGLLHRGTFGQLNTLCKLLQAPRCHHPLLVKIIVMMIGALVIVGD